MFKKLAAAAAVTGALLSGVLVTPAMAGEPAHATVTSGAFSVQAFATGRANTGGPTLKVRKAQLLSAPIVQQLTNGTVFNIGCYQDGDTVNGNWVWYWASDYEGYVSAAYVKVLSGNPSSAKCDF